MSAADGLSALKTLYDISTKVKDNQEELQRISRRLEHIVHTLEESRQRDIIRPDEYNDAWSVITELIGRAQRIARRMLKRTLGDRTWNAAEITADLRRLNEDVQSYLGVHTLKIIDIMYTSQIGHNETIAADVKEIMARLAEIGLHLKSPTGDAWSPAVLEKAKAHKHAMLIQCEEEIATSNPARLSEDFQNGLQQTTSTFRAKSYNHVTIEGVKGESSHAHENIVLRGLKHSHKEQDILDSIKQQGFNSPDRLHIDSKLHIVVTNDVSIYDASAPNGLQISRDEPIRWWWNKYLEYHDISPTTNHGHTVAILNYTKNSILTADVEIRFHRTFRVPDGNNASQLPPSLGHFPLLPISNYAKYLPKHIVEQGGFMTAMFQSEALWVSFRCDGDGSGDFGPAIKLSVGGVNAISGNTLDELTPPDDAQDYVVAGLQPWLDGIATGPGVFVVSNVGKGHTVEEQVAQRTSVCGMQFDIFPRRVPAPVTLWNIGFDSLDDLKTPGELGITIGERLIMHPDSLLSKNWTIGESLRRVSQNIVFSASYEDDSMCLSLDSWASDPSGSPFMPGSAGSPRSSFIPFASLVERLSVPPEDVDTLVMGASPTSSLARDPESIRPLGISAGGKIVQRVYEDPVSPRAYDEEHGDRFYIHMFTPEQWEDITGMLAPITPITKDKYLQHGIPWFTLQDKSIPSISSTSAALAAVKSVTQLEQERRTKETERNPIDPNHPPRCSRHPKSLTTSVFRPCGHAACSACLGATMVLGSKCCFCEKTVKKFVGMKAPLPVVAPGVSVEGAEEGAEWNVEDVEELAAAAADNNRLEVIYFAGTQRVPPLHAGGRNETRRA